MVTKKNTTKKGKVRVGKLKLNKETVKDLTGSDAKRIKVEGLQKFHPTHAAGIAIRAVRRFVEAVA